MNELFLGLLLFLQAADAWTTYRGLRDGGRERNPLIRFFVDKLGLFWGLAAGKLVGVVGVVWIYSIGNPALAGGFCAIYGWVVWRNWKAIQEQRKG